MTNRVAVVLGVMGSVVLAESSEAFDRDGSAAIGANVGGIQYFADESSSDDASPRFSFGAYGEYSPSTSFTMRLESGAGWVSYSEDKSPAGAALRDPHPVKVVSPNTLSFIRRFGGESERQLYLGVGPGFYFWRFRINGKRQQDPLTFETIQSGKVGSFDFGLHGLLGYEYPIAESVALTGEARAHYVFSANEDDRPDKPADSEFVDFPVFNGNDFFAGVRFGVKLYFQIDRFEEPEPEWEIPE